MFGACRLAKYVRHTKSTMSRVIMSGCVNQAVNVRAGRKTFGELARLRVSGRATSLGSQMGLALVGRQSKPQGRSPSP